MNLNITLNEDQASILEIMSDLQEGSDLSQEDFHNTIFLTGLLILFDKLVVEEVQLMDDTGNLVANV